MEEYIYDGKIMGTDFSIAIICSDKHRADNQAQRSLQKLRLYEERFSRFLPMSELTQLNIHKQMIVSPEFFLVTMRAIQLSKDTHGLFNPLFQIARLGYTQSCMHAGHADTSTEQDDAHYDVDITTIYCDKKKSQITLQPGQKLDFGGFLKGYVAEKICKEIKKSSRHITGVIVNIGGDLHTQGYDCHNEKFTFSIFNPLTQKSDITVPLYNQSLSTSGTYKRTWQYNQQTVHHILDGSGSANPNTDNISVSIIHPHGDVSEAYTKVYFTQGPDEAERLLNDTRTSYIIITKDNNIQTNI